MHYFSPLKKVVQSYLILFLWADRPVGMQISGQDCFPWSPIALTLRSGENWSVIRSKWALIMHWGCSQHPLVLMERPSLVGSRALNRQNAPSSSPSAITNLKKKEVSRRETNESHNGEAYLPAFSDSSCSPFSLTRGRCTTQNISEYRRLITHALHSAGLAICRLIRHVVTPWISAELQCLPDACQFIPADGE